MNEVLDPEFSAEETAAEEKNLQENTENTAVEQVENAAESTVVPQEAPAMESLSEEKDAVENPDSKDADDIAVSEISKKLTKQEIISLIKKLIDGNVDAVKSEIDFLKQAFYRIKKDETDEALKIFEEAEAEKAEDEKTEDEKTEFQVPRDPLESELKMLLFKFKERKSKLQAEEDRLKDVNLEEKRSILEELKKLTESQGDFNKIYNEFRRLQQRWKELKLVPQSASGDLWKEYQHCNEIFYDLVKINNELREYDFKKNLESKIALCEAVELLDEETDMLSAFRQLQKFHQEWKEIGPVAKDLRDDIWNRFKLASSSINKKHQDFFDRQRESEQANLEAKTAICEKIETINYDELINFKTWDEMNKYVLELQQEWKKIGFTPKKHNAKIFARFRTACDTFFHMKSTFYRQIKDKLEKNLERKRKLCEQAEALKDSTEWRETSENLAALQREWKTIGAVARKHSDVVWRRFISACDYFFEQKNKISSSQKEEEVENLRLKNELIDKINAIGEDTDKEEATATFYKLITEWNSVGFVPFKEKDKLHKKYVEAVDKYFDRLKVEKAERRLQFFKSSFNDIGSGNRAKNRLLDERDKLMRAFEKLKTDIQTYENNMGFLSVASKGGGSLVEEMNTKIDGLKAELDLVVKKIQVIDDNIDGNVDEK
jgi:hypothetical protein